MPLVELTLAADRASSAALDQRLAAFAGNPAKYQRLARVMAREIRKYSRARIRRQQTLGGEPFPARKNGRGKRKMLLGLGKTLEIMSRASSSSQGVTLGWKNNLRAGIAGRHQRGEGENWTPARARKVYGVPDYQSPCTPRQARALLREGYRLPTPAKGKKTGSGGSRKKLKRVSSRWLQEHLTLGQAGLILRLLKTGARKGKQAWRDTVPARPFLGVAPVEVEALLELLGQQILRDVKK